MTPWVKKLTGYFSTGSPSTEERRTNHRRFELVWRRSMRARPRPRFSSSRLLVLAFVLATFEPGGLIHAAPATPEDEAFVAGFVAAFRSDPGVRAEIEELKRLGYRDEGLTSIPVGGGCGFAGCDNVLLVVQLFSSEGVNPRTTPVLALVSLRLPGGSHQVQRVEFAPKKETTAGLEIERMEPAPQPQLEIQEKILPPPVQLEAIPERRTPGP